MKKMLCLILVLLMIGAMLVSCSNDVEPQAMTTEPANTAAPQTTAPATEAPATETPATEAPATEISETPASTTPAQTAAPMELHIGRGAKTIAVGYGLTLAVREDGTVLADDQDGWRDLGLLSSWKDIGSVSTNGSIAAGVRMDGTVEAVWFGCDPLDPVFFWQDFSGVIDALAAIDDAAQLDIGETVAAVLHSDGTVSAFNFEGRDTRLADDVTDVVQVAAGEGQILCLKSNGTVAGRGSFSSGEDINLWKNVVDIDCSGRNYYAVTKDGKVHTTITEKQLRDRTANWTNVVKISASGAGVVALRADGSAVGNLQNRWFYDYGPKFGDWSGVTDVACGETHSVGLRADGTLAVTGKVGDELKAALEIKDAEAVSAGWNHVLALMKDGTVTAAGSDDGGQCGVSNWENIADISAGSYYSVGLTGDGKILYAGKRSYSRVDSSISKAVEWTDITAIAAGEKALLGLRSNGELAYTQGQYDGGDYDEDHVGQMIQSWEELTAITGGSGYGVAIDKKGEIRCIGKAKYWELDVSDWKGVTAVSMKGSVCIGLKKDGTVYVGGNTAPWEQIENGREITPYNDFAKEIAKWNNVKEVSAGENVFAALKKDGTVATEWMWGEPPIEICSWKNVKAVDCGNGFVIALKTDGTLLGAGPNGFKNETIRTWSGIRVNEKETGND